MSDTPRTDAQALATGYAKGHGFVPVAFAKQLEMEMAEMRKEYLGVLWSMKAAIEQRMKDAPGTAGKVGGVGSEHICPNCVTPWKCNGPHIER